MRIVRLGEAVHTMNRDVSGEGRNRRSIHRNKQGGGTKWYSIFYGSLNDVPGGFILAQSSAPVHG